MFNGATEPVLFLSTGGKAVNKKDKVPAFTGLILMSKRNTVKVCIKMSVTAKHKEQKCRKMR